MALPAVLLAKLAAAVVSNEGMRRKAGWIVAAILSPFIVTLTLFCSLLSGGAEHNRSAVLLSFHGGDIPRQTPCGVRCLHRRYAPQLCAAGRCHCRRS